MGKNVDNDSHSREGRNEDLRLETNFSYPAHAHPLSHSFISLLALNGSLMWQAVPDSIYGHLLDALPRMLWKNLALPFGTTTYENDLYYSIAQKTLIDVKDSETAAEAVASTQFANKTYRVVYYNDRILGNHIYHKMELSGSHIGVLSVVDCC